MIRTEIIGEFVERCAQCGRVLGAGPTYAFRGSVYHDSCTDFLRKVQAETEAQLRAEFESAER